VRNEGSIIGPVHWMAPLQSVNEQPFQDRRVPEKRSKTGHETARNAAVGRALGATLQLPQN